MQTRVVVVTLDMLKEAGETSSDDSASTVSSPYYDQHPLVNAGQIRHCIDATCKKLLIKEPNSKWLFVWPEHGLGHKPLVEKRPFRAMMSALTIKYPQLAIIAGSIRTIQRYAADDVLQVKRMFQRGARAYKANHWVEKKEASWGEVGAAAHHEGWLSQRADIGFEAKCVVRNTSYVFVRGHCVARHDKVAPWNELGSHWSSNTMFQVAAGSSRSAFVDLKFKDGVTIPIGIEICREHILGVLKRESMVSGRPLPLIHFIVSDSIDGARVRLVEGEYMMNADTRTWHSLKQMTADCDPSFEVVRYGVDFFERADHLYGPHPAELHVTAESDLEENNVRRMTT